MPGAEEQIGRGAWRACCSLGPTWFRTLCVHHMPVLTRHPIHTHTTLNRCDAQEREAWEGRSVLVYWLELGAELALHSLSLAHYLHLWWGGRGGGGGGGGEALGVAGLAAGGYLLDWLLPLHCCCPWLLLGCCWGLPGCCYRRPPAGAMGSRPCPCPPGPHPPAAGGCTASSCSWLTVCSFWT